MSVVSIKSRKKSWQTGRERVTVLAALAIQRETVVRVLTELRDREGHPEKPGEPLPQDKAAARINVAARTWQRWEAGEVIPYARHLSAIADEFEFDVGRFYEADQTEKRPTPDLLSDPLEERIARLVDVRLAEQTARLEQLLDEAREREDRYLQDIGAQNELLARQSKILERIEDSIARDEKITRDQEESANSLIEASQRALRVLEAASEEPEATGRTPARSGSRRAS